MFGYSILLKLLQKDPQDYYDYLFQPCGSAALHFWSASSEDDVSRIFTMFKSSKFGFCYVETRDGVHGIVTLRDLLSLYDRDIMETDLSAGAVASPIFSMQGGSALKDALREIFRRRARRVFISGSKSLVSDRGIISYITSPEKLRELRDAPHKAFDATLKEVGPVDTTEVEGDMSIRRAVRAIKGEAEECLVCPAGVVTPWDLVMKPWIAGRLRIRDSVKGLMQTVRDREQYAKNLKSNARRNRPKVPDVTRSANLPRPS